MKKIVVICKGGFGKEMLDYLSDTFSADSGYEFERIQDLFPDDELIVKPDEVFVVANGDPAVKARLVKKIEQAGGQLLSVIHPTCYVAKTATIGPGVIMCPFAYVGPGAVPGEKEGTYWFYFFGTAAPHDENRPPKVKNDGGVGRFLLRIDA